MGDIAFNITKNVDLNKVVELDIDKDVDVNVNIDDLLATAEADAEVFATFGLAEVDAYTYVSEGEPGETIFVENPGLIDVLGNTINLTVTDPNGDGVPDSITVDFNAEGDELLPDADDLNAFGSLEPLNGIPVPPADTPIPVPLLAITDLSLTLSDIIIPGEEGRYVSNEWVADFGERTLDLDGDGDFSTSNLSLTIPAGSTFLAEQLATGAVEVQYEGVAGDAFFSFDGTDYEVTNLVLEAESLQDPTVGIGDWAFEASSDFGDIIVTPPTPGEAFAYAESTSAADLNGDGDIL